jgi:hypothetical protein
MGRTEELILEIRYLKRKLGDLWESKGKTDQEVLELAEKIDDLLNEYDRRLRNLR